MLQHIRKFSVSWVSKALLTVLVGSFAIWGITDFIKPRFKSEHVAIVGKETISKTEFYQAYRNALSNLRKEFGDKIEKDSQIHMILASQVLTNLIQEALLKQEEKKLNLLISEETLREIIQKDDLFKDEAGLFSKKKYDTFLQSRNLTEPLYLHLLMNEIKRGFLMQSVLRSIKMPQTLKNPLEEALREARDIMVVSLDAAPIPISETPSEKELMDFYSKNENLFALPETRDLSLIVLDPTINLTKIKTELPNASPEELHQATIEHIYEIGTEIQDMLASGETLSEIASKKGLFYENVKAITTTGHNSNGDLLVKEGKSSFTLDTIAKAFELNEGIESDLIEGKDGKFYIVFVDSISPKTLPLFEEIKGKVISSYKDKARKVLAFERAKKIAEQVRKGASLGVVAKENNLKVEILKNISLLNPSKTISDTLFLRLFSIPQGGIEAVATEKGAQIGQVLKIIPNSISQQDKKVQEELQAMEQDFSQDIAMQFIKSLEEEFSLEINKAAIQEIVLEP